MHISPSRNSNGSTVRRSDHDCLDIVHTVYRVRVECDQHDRHSLFVASMRIEYDPEAFQLHLYYGALLICTVTMRDLKRDYRDVC